MICFRSLHRPISKLISFDICTFLWASMCFFAGFCYSTRSPNRKAKDLWKSYDFCMFLNIPLTKIPDPTHSSLSHFKRLKNKRHASYTFSQKSSLFHKTRWRTSRGNVTPDNSQPQGGWGVQRWFGRCGSEPLGFWKTAASLWKPEKASYKTQQVLSGSF